MRVRRIPHDPAELLEILPALIDGLIEEAQDDLQAALNQLQENLSELIESDPGNFGAANDMVLAFLEVAVEAGDDLQDLLADALGPWGEHFGENAEALADLLRGLYERFAEMDVFPTMLAALVAGIPDFPSLFLRLALMASEHLPEYRDTLEAVLLPFFFAGITAFGADAGAEALQRVLKDGATTLTRRVTWLDLGVAPAGLTEWQRRMLQGAAFTMPAAVSMMAALLEGLRKASSFGSLLPNGASVPNPVLHAALGPAIQFIGQVVTGYVTAVDALLEALVAQLLEGAENDFELEWLLLQLARFTPVGVLFVLVGTKIKLLTSPAPWLELLLNPIENDPRLKVLRLPRPSPDRKYIIFSDLHRDEKSDERPPFEFGSIDHFTPNRERYLELLRHYAGRGYTIIEAGDCEELWFHRDFTSTPDQKLERIIETHGEIYDFLRSLHAEGRYFRVFGNHDSYLRDPGTFQILAQAMERPGASSFQIFDFIVIEGVKTMHDVPFFLGLDSDPNTERRPLIVTHGHQWDFWNCDANNILGKLIVSAVVTPLDMLDDPFRDLAGISSQGSPMMDFNQILSGLPVFSSWQSHEPAVQMLDAIQHMKDRDRRFTDDVQYSETLASLMGLLIPVASGPGDSCGLSLDGRCLFNLMSIGHTHNPHNEPYYDLKVLPVVKQVLTDLQDTIADATNGLFTPELGLVKSHYLNSGVSGWYEECFWAIDLGDESHGTGQPKLVTWTRNTRTDRPNHMDWELPHIPRQGAPTPGDRVDDLLKGFLDALRDLAEDGAKAVGDALLQAPAGYVAAAASKTWKAADLTLSFGKGASRDAAGPLLFQTILGLVSPEGRSFKATIELPASVAEGLKRALGQPFPAAHTSERERLAMAIGTLAVIEEMAVAGLRSGVGLPDPEGRRACLGVLALLAQLQESRVRRLGVALRLERDRILAEFTIDPDTAVEHHPLPGGKLDGSLPSGRPVREVTLDGKENGRRGVVVRAYLEQAGTPLSGWTVAVEQRIGRRAQTIAQARTNRQGEARLLRIRVSDRRLIAPGFDLESGPLALVLYAPSGKEALRRTLDPRAMGSRISLPVSFELLRTLGFYPGSKIRPVDEKVQDLCNRWQKRLADPRDPHAKDDLCLTDLMLGAVAGLGDPKTALQKEVAKTLRGYTKHRDRDALDAVANYAEDARGALRACLGGQYAPCEHDGTLRELGERLLKENGRMAGLMEIFANPVPDPEGTRGVARAGLGLPSSGIDWTKSCIHAFEHGEMDEEIADAMAEYYPQGKRLAAPSVNVIEVWDPLGGGMVVRRTEVHQKRLNFWFVRAEGGNATLEGETLEMDVELDSPECLVVEADMTGRQVVITDVNPGQRVTLFGSGFVDERGTVRADFRAWEAEPSDGRLVPDEQVLPADGFSGFEVEVEGQLLPVTDDATPESYNGDKIIFTWPAEASKPGLYRIRAVFANRSQYPSSVGQNPDCTLTVGRDDVPTQELYFAVLPPVNAPSVRVLGREVVCEDLTDPEGFLGIPWPDDVLFNASAVLQRIQLPTNGGEPAVELRATTTRQADRLFWGPESWTPALRLFPENQGFGQMAALEFLLVDFELLETEGDFDKFVVQLLYIAALVTIAIIVAAVLTALVALVIVALVALGVITAGTAEAVAVPIALAFLSAAFGFVFGAAFVAFLGLKDALNAVVGGADRIVSGQTQVDGMRLMLQLSPVRFHRALFPVGDSGVDATQQLATIQEVFEESALGGRYEVAMLVEKE